MRNHLVPHFIVRSFRDASKVTTLYDFRSKEIQRLSGKQADELFSVENALTAAEEQFINRNGEARIAEIVATFDRGNPELKSDSKAALHELFVLHAGRYSKVNGDEPNLLDAVHSKRGSDLTSFWQLMDSRFKLVFVEPPGGILCCPNTGLFPILLTGPKVIPHIGLVIPLRPRLCIIQLPRSADGFDQTVSFGNLLLDSIGNSAKMDQVLIPPLLTESMDEAELHAWMQSARERTDKVYASFAGSMSFALQKMEYELAPSDGEYSGGGL